MTSRQDLRRIELLAYRLWEREGCPAGRARDSWLKAEKLLSDECFLEEELDREEWEGGIPSQPSAPVLAA